MRYSMIGRYYVCILGLVFLVGNTTCTTTPERREKASPKVTVSVESGQDKSDRDKGEPSLKDISDMNKKAKEESKEPSGLMDRVKSFLFRLKIPF